MQKINLFCISLIPYQLLKLKSCRGFTQNNLDERVIKLLIGLKSLNERLGVRGKRAK